MAQIIWYAIRHIPTGRLLPAPPVKQRSGQTHTTFDCAAYMPPRLFPTKEGANVAMKLWLRGDWTSARQSPQIPVPNLLASVLNKPRRINRRQQVVFTNSRAHMHDLVEVVPVEVVVQPIIRPVIEDDEI
jgi:hypothetical protein